MTNHPPLPLQLLDGPHDPHPQPLTVEVALVQELVGAHVLGAGQEARRTIALWFDRRPGRWYSKWRPSKWTILVTDIGTAS